MNQKGTKCFIGSWSKYRKYLVHELNFTEYWKKQETVESKKCWDDLVRKEIHEKEEK